MYMQVYNHEFDIPLVLSFPVHLHFLFVRDVLVYPEVFANVWLRINVFLQWIKLRKMSQKQTFIPWGPGSPLSPLTKMKNHVNSRLPLLRQLNTTWVFFTFMQTLNSFWIPKANGKKTIPINITNKISKSILVAVFSRCIRRTGHSELKCRLSSPKFKV